MNSIVIGSGFGGMAAALRLKAKGHNVTGLFPHKSDIKAEGYTEIVIKDE